MAVVGLAIVYSIVLSDSGLIEFRSLIPLFRRHVRSLLSWRRPLDNIEEMMGEAALEESELRVSGFVLVDLAEMALVILGVEAFS